MTCPACVIAETNPMTGHYGAGCLNCSARSIAHSPEFKEAGLADALTPGYRSALQTVFGRDWASAHAMVKRWADRIEKATNP